MSVPDETRTGITAGSRSCSVLEVRHQTEESLIRTINSQLFRNDDINTDGLNVDT